MKICFLLYNLNVKNGGGRFAYEFIENLRKSRPDIKIMILSTDGSGYDLERVIIPKRKIKALFLLWHFRRILKDYDIIHAFDAMPYGAIAALSCLGLDKKIIITPVGSGSIKPLYNWWRLILLKWIFSRVNKIVSISSYTTKEMKKKLKDFPIETLPLATNYDAFIKNANNFSDKDAVFEILGSKPYILSVGGVKPRKGYMDSVRVFARVAKVMPDLSYVIVGIQRGSYYQQLLKLIKSLGIEDRVIFKKDISDEHLALYYQEAELFILLSQNIEFDVEGFGLVFLEAAIFGLPVIGTSNSGAEDAILDGKNGYLVNPQNTQLIGDLIIKILENKEIKTNFGLVSKQLAKNRNWDKFTNEYIKIYELLFAGSIQRKK